MLNLSITKYFQTPCNCIAMKLIYVVGDMAVHIFFVRTIIFFISQTKSTNVEEYLKRRDEQDLALVLHNAWQPRFVVYVLFWSCWRREHSQREFHQRYTEKHVAVWLIYCMEACSMLPEERINQFFFFGNWKNIMQYWNTNDTTENYFGIEVLPTFLA